MASMNKSVGLAEGVGSLLGAHGRRLNVLIFHRVLPEPDPLCPSEMHAARFDALLGALRRVFNILPMDEALARHQRGSLPPRALAITFDDGYADNFTIACPILVRHGLKATFFVASGFLDGGIMWNDAAREAVRSFAGAEIDLGWLELGVRPVANDSQRGQLVEEMLLRLKYLTPAVRLEALERLRAQLQVSSPSDLMLSTEQLRQMHALGMEIGGHTVAHPILAVLSETEARRQIAEDRERLGAILGRPPRYFAYPNGKPEKDYRRVDASGVRELGYEAAFTTSPGSVGPESGLFELPRFTPWDQGRVRFSLRLAHNYFRGFAPRLLADGAAA